jgi:hypothetical protein
VIAVALRLAWGGRGDFARITLTILACALLTLIGLGAVSWAGGHGHDAAGALVAPNAVAGTALVALPALGILLLAARLAAAPRDRRLNALRLAGATPRQIRALAAFDGAVAAVVGVAFGLVGYGALHAVAGHWWIVAHAFGPYLAIPAALPYLPVAALLVAVPVVSALVGAAALNRIPARPGGALPEAAGPGPRPWALVPLGAGLMLELTAQPGARRIELAGVLVRDPQLTGGYLLALFGIGALGPWLIHRVARTLARHARGPVALLAARRIAADARSVGRMLIPIAVLIAAATTFVPLRAARSRYLFGGSFPVHSVTLAAFAGAIVVGCTALGLLVSTLESLASRHREVAALKAIGAPASRLRQTLLLRNAVPTLVVVLVAALGGLATATPALLARTPVSQPPAPVALDHSSGLLLALRLAMLAIAALTVAVTVGTALVLPTLRRLAEPSELRYE